MDQFQQHNDRRDFWREHIAKARDFDGTDKEYCRRHDLNVHTFYGYKKRLKAKPPEKRKFAKLVSDGVTPERSRKPGRLPDPKWLADFLNALQNR